MAIITYLGHSTVLVKHQETTILFDPFISGNELATNIDIESIQPDYILVSHGHQDHILDVEKIANQSGATIVSNYEIANYFANKGLTTIGVNHGGTLRTDQFSAKYVNAVHTSSFPDGSYAGQPGGFVLNIGNSCIYFAGDTALTYDMKLIAEEFNVDIAILPIGDHFTMGYKDAIKAAKFVGTQKVIGVHYDTFPPIAINQEKAMKAFHSTEIELILLNISEEFSL